MTTFCYLTDTHFGYTLGEGYSMQPRHPEPVEKVLTGLHEWLSEKPVDFILHGGDLVEHGNEKLITKFAEKFSAMPCPAYLCLGNHDLDSPESYQLWKEHHMGLLPNNKPNYKIELEDVNVYVMAVSYAGAPQPYYWETAHIPVISDQQKQDLEQYLASSTKPVILATHVQVNAIPSSQTGLCGEVGEPDCQYQRYLVDLARRFPMLHLIMTGHNHVNTLARFGNLITMTTNAFTETPFDLRVVTIDEKNIEVATHSLRPWIDPQAEFNAEFSWALGGPSQRECTIPVRKAKHDCSCPA
ncbi:MAG: metallophosphoesterase family protein [Phycisphaeraceae bacterium JB051]